MLLFLLFVLLFFESFRKKNCLEGGAPASPPPVAERKVVMVVSVVGRDEAAHRGVCGSYGCLYCVACSPQELMCFGLLRAGESWVHSGLHLIKIYRTCDPWVEA